MVTRKKTEEVVETVEEEEQEDGLRIDPYDRFFMLGEYIRTKAPEVLKFDSNVANINYDYVDTQQYKTFLGSCCDAFGFTFSFLTEDMDLIIHENDNGKQQFIVKFKGQVEFSCGADWVRSIPVVGLGVSVGNNYAASVAQTNALRNFITNNFLLPTNDRDNNDMKCNVNQDAPNAKAYLTESQKAEKKEKLLSETKSSVEYSTLLYGKVMKGRLEKAIAKDGLDEKTKGNFSKFMEKNYDEKGDPVCLDGNPELWNVTTAIAARVMSDLDGALNG